MKRTDLIAAAIAIALGGNASDNAEVNAIASEIIGAKEYALNDMKS